MTTYPWASNSMKLQFAEKDLIEAKKLNPTLVINEDSIKAAYIKCGGLIMDVVTPEAIVAPVVEDKAVEPSPVVRRGRPRRS